MKIATIMSRMRRATAAALLGGALLAGVTSASQALTLTVVDSLSTPSPYGLLFDGTHVWFSRGADGNILYEIDQNAPGMPLTGNTVTTVSGGERAWDGSHFVTARNRTVYFTNPDGTLAGTVTVDGRVAGSVLVDGLDYDHGEIWFSPYRGNVYRLDGTTGAFTGRNPVLHGSGSVFTLTGAGFSGVERVDVGSRSFLIVFDAFGSPRGSHRFCKTTLTGFFHPTYDCARLAGSRISSAYRGLAFDGRYLYAADYLGNRVDKIDLKLAGGRSIFVPGNPPAVPEPLSLGLLGGGLAGLGWARRAKA